MKTNSNVFDIFKEITVLNAKLPALPRRARKNLFDILKIQHREIRNSNILAYFFDPNEEHDFRFLFYESLQEIAVEKVAELTKSDPNIPFNDISAFDEVKTVVTEEQTKGTVEKIKSLDIVLEGDDWVIGIENKIHHHLANPINTYWSHLKSKKKTPFGILLTLFPYQLDQGKLKDGNYFLNITHKELLEKVQQNIQLTGEVSNTDFFYLKEYFKNIESHYFHLKHQPEMENIVHGIADNYVSIIEILKKKEAAENYIEEQIITAFSNHRYVKASKWFRREDKEFDLYFYLPPASELMRTNSLWLCYEIRNQTNRNINKNEFLRHFQNEFEQHKNFKQLELATTNQHTHAFIYQEHNFFQKGISFKVKLDEVLKRLIEDIDSPVKKVEKYLKDRNYFFRG